MSLVAKITVEQKNQLVGKLYSSDCFFNPVLDADGNWVISEIEVKGNTNPEVNWVNSLPLSVYKSIPWTPPSLN